MSAAAPDPFRAGLELADQHEHLVDRPEEFELLGLRWTLLPTVFAPTHTTSTEFFTRHLPYPDGGSFLEIGCGAGVTAVWAALHGCTRVVASDIGPTAVRNAEANVHRHRVDDRARAVVSDLFDAIDPDERFDLVFWNAVVIKAPVGYTHTREIEYAIFDPGYAANARYLEQAPGRLAPGGRLMMGFNSLGDLAMLHGLAAERGVRLEQVATMRNTAGEFTVDFFLFEVLPM